MSQHPTSIFIFLVVFRHCWTKCWKPAFTNSCTQLEVKFHDLNVVFEFCIYTTVHTKFSGTSGFADIYQPQSPSLSTQYSTISWPCVSAQELFFYFSNQYCTLRDCKWILGLKWFYSHCDYFSSHVFLSNSSEKFQGEQPTRLHHKHSMYLFAKLFHLHL